MDTLHIGAWPTLGSTKTCIWSGSSRMVGRAGQTSFYSMHVSGLITCKDVHLAKDKYRGLLCHRQGNPGLSLKPPGQRTKLSLKDNIFHRYNHWAIWIFEHVGVLAMVLRFPNFSICQNMGHCRVWCQTSSSLLNPRDTAPIHLVRMTFHTVKRDSLNSHMKCQQPKRLLQPCLWTDEGAHHTVSRNKSSLPVLLPEKPRKLVRNAAWPHSVIRMAHGIPTACQVISKAITLPYYTCLALY